MYGPKEHTAAKLEADLKIEKEWRQQLQKTTVSDKEALYKTQEDLKYWQKVGQVMTKGEAAHWAGPLPKIKC